MSTQDFLVEIGTEELPPKVLPSLIAAFKSSIVTSLQEQKLEFGQVKEYAAPRRLALYVADLQRQAPDQQAEIWGPPERVAFDKEGAPTRAALAFAKKNGLAEAELQLEDSPKGKRLVHRSTITGVSSSAIMPEIIRAGLDALPIPKRMHWGCQRELFVRPVHWVVLMLGEQVLSTDILESKPGAAPRDTVSTIPSQSP